jgi:hypothetical protein
MQGVSKLKPTQESAWCPELCFSFRLQCALDRGYRLSLSSYILNKRPNVMSQTATGFLFLILLAIPLGKSWELNDSAYEPA